MSAVAPDYETFALGDFPLDKGGTIPGAFVAYKTYGTLSPARDNAICTSNVSRGRRGNAFVSVTGSVTAKRLVLGKPATRFVAVATRFVTVTVAPTAGFVRLVTTVTGSAELADC